MAEAASGQWSVGVGKADLTPSLRGIGMLGFGVKSHTAEGVSQRLWARAFALDDGDGGRLVYAVGDFCFVTESIREEVLRRLAHKGIELSPHQVMLAATHTHSAPGGYTHFLLYNLLVPGFSQPVLDRYAEGLAEAIAQAVRSLAPGRAQFAAGPIPEDDPVAFNRALGPYNLNPDVVPATPATAHLAVDRTMSLLRLDVGDRAIGAFAWFGTHACSVHSDLHAIHGDHKGCASAAMESWAADRHGAAQFVAGFPQTTPGDVTPNHRWSKERGFSVGVDDDDYVSAETVGRLQANHAQRLWTEAGASRPLSGALAARIHYQSHEELDVDADLVEGRPGVRTGRSMLGINMMHGTDEGPGPLLAVPWATKPLKWLMQAVVSAARLGRSERAQGVKYPFLDTAAGGRGKAFGFFNQGDPFLPGFIDPVVARVRELKKLNGIGNRPWTNPIVGLQLFAIGPIAILGLPGEPTTTAGVRLRATVAEPLRALGVNRVICAGYSNNYAGYITTEQEYDFQRYEGASTYFGRYTLAGYQTRLRRLASELVKGPQDWSADTGTTPLTFGPEELANRLHIPRPTAVDAR